MLQPLERCRADSLEDVGPRCARLGQGSERGKTSPGICCHQPGEALLSPDGASMRDHVRLLGRKRIPLSCLANGIQLGRMTPKDPLIANLARPSCRGAAVQKASRASGVGEPGSARAQSGSFWGAAVQRASKTFGICAPARATAQSGLAISGECCSFRRAAMAQSPEPRAAGFAAISPARRSWSKMAPERALCVRRPLCFLGLTLMFSSLLLPSLLTLRDYSTLLTLLYSEVQGLCQLWRVGTSM